MTNNVELFKQKLTTDAGLRWRLLHAAHAYDSHHADDLAVLETVVVPIARSVGIELEGDEVLDAALSGRALTHPGLDAAA